jgi:TPR repeat protein
MIVKQTTSTKTYLKALSFAKEKSPDLERVSELLFKAKEQGSGEAAYALATWYLQGNYFKKNLKKGTQLLKLAAKAGVPLACFDLGVSFETGIVVSKNNEKAFHLYMEAALRGDGTARKEVARCLWHGIGTPKNRVLAHLWGRSGVLSE